MENIFEKKGEFIIFKDSTRCPISVRAAQEVEKYEGPLEVVRVDVLTEPELKMEIAKKYGVTHESPQILVIKDQKCVEHFSHHDITLDRLKKIA